MDVSGLTDEEIEELEFEEAIDERYKQSYEKRIRQRNREIASKLLTLGMPVDAIHEATSLEREEIEQLRLTLSQ